MVRQEKSSQGRVTPKGTVSTSASSARREPVNLDSRSSAIVPILMFGLFALGLVIIVGNYMVEVLGAPSNWYLFIGLGCILGGIVAATQYR